MEVYALMIVRPYVGATVLGIYAREEDAENEVPYEARDMDGVWQCGQVFYFITQHVVQ